MHFWRMDKGVHFWRMDKGVQPKGEVKDVYTFVFDSEGSGICESLVMYFKTFNYLSEL